MTEQLVVNTETGKITFADESNGENVVDLVFLKEVEK